MSSSGRSFVTSVTRVTRLARRTGGSDGGDDRGGRLRDRNQPIPGSCLATEADINTYGPQVRREPAQRTRKRPRVFRPLLVTAEIIRDTPRKLGEQLGCRAPETRLGNQGERG